MDPDDTTLASRLGLGRGLKPTGQDTLPSVVESVSQAQKQQSDKLTQYHHVLQRLKIHLQEELGKVNAVQRELKECEKTHFCQEEGIAEHTAKCKQLKKEIFHLLEEDFQLRTDVSALEQGVETDQRIHSEYTDKMMQHKTQALELEKAGSIQLVLAEQEELLKRLQAEKTELLSFSSNGSSSISSSSSSDPVTKMKDEIESLRATKQQIERQIKEKESLIQEEHQQQASLLQDIAVLKKRNHAQLLRLRNQVKEAQMRNHQWHEEACQMEQQIAQLQQLISDQER